VPGATVSLQKVAQAARPGWENTRPQGVEAGLEETHYWPPPTVTWSYAVIGSRRVRASGNAAAQRAAIAQNPCAPKRFRNEPGLMPNRRAASISEYIGSSSLRLGIAALPQFAVAEAVLDYRPRVAIGLLHFFENLAVLALEPATDGGVVGIGVTGEHPQHFRELQLFSVMARTDADEARR
jgi:hypothetical protein